MSIHQINSDSVGFSSNNTDKVRVLVEVYPCHFLTFNQTFLRGLVLIARVMSLK